MTTTRGAEGAIRPGFVYIVKGADGAYKIGGTGKLERRVRQLGYGEHAPVDLVKASYVDDVLAWERRLQRCIYAARGSQRRAVEWFRLTAEELRLVLTEMERTPQHAKYAWFLGHRSKGSKRTRPAQEG